jgi:GLPGLI family protein
MMIKKTVLMALLFCAWEMRAQIHAAKIIFERKTNLYKLYKGEDWINRAVKEEDKIKTDYFELFATDSVSLFQPQESDLKENYSWATAKNTVHQNFRDNTRYTVKTIWGEELHITDSVIRRTWRISESTRKIAGYVCRKAVWKANDSTRIYAWFSYDILPSTGPESFNGLPGVILGLANEDGGVVYFAKKVEIVNPEAKELQVKKKKKIYKLTELKAQLTKQYGHEKWFKREMNKNFGIW